MSNDAMNLYKELTEQTVATVRNLGELNLRTFETLASKQVEIMQKCMDAGVKQAEILKTAKDANGLISAQVELSSACAEQFTNNMMETADIMKTAQEELSNLVESSVADAKANVEKVTELGKKSVDEVVNINRPAKSTKKAA